MHTSRKIIAQVLASRDTSSCLSVGNVLAARNTRFTARLLSRRRRRGRRYTTAAAAATRHRRSGAADLPLAATTAGLPLAATNMHAAFVDGHLAAGIVNVLLYTALLLLTLRLRPIAPLFPRSQLEQHSLVAERPLQHFVYQLILLFCVGRLFWASWVLAMHDGYRVKVPAGAVGFYTDSLGTSAFFVGVFLVVTQVRIGDEVRVKVGLGLGLVVREVMD